MSQNFHDEPDTYRVPTEFDEDLAVTLSTIWPLSKMHADAALHLALYINDHPALTEAYITDLRFRAMTNVDACEQWIRVLEEGGAKGTGPWTTATQQLKTMKESSE